MFVRILLSACLGTMLLAPAAVAEVQTYFGFQIGITNAPPPPQVVFESAPRCEPVSGVYVAVQDDYDCDVFRYGTYWYVVSNGYWYRARSHRGPFRVIDARRVPRAVFAVPASHWRHHPHGGPPGQMKKHGRGRGSMAGRDR